jgi:hypothetical protein
MEKDFPTGTLQVLGKIIGRGSMFSSPGGLMAFRASKRALRL